MAPGELTEFYRAYIERVVNQHDISAVDDMVSADYIGGGYGWPASIEDLRRFYSRQNRTQPDWRIDIQGCLEVGEWVAVRAFAGSREASDDDGSPQAPVFPTSLEWLANVRVVNRRIVEIRLVSLVDHSAQ